MKIGIVQMCSGTSVDDNIATASHYIRDARADGAEIIFTPEMTNILELNSKALFENIFLEDDDPALKAFQALAAELGCWLAIGSLAIKLPNGKAANRGYVISPNGEVQTHYDKAHMFDVDLAGGESYRESKNFEAGDKLALSDTPWGKMGLSICYDVRFPYLYRKLATLGAKLLTVPAAFTQKTGEAHWHILLRSRAIETGSYVIAAAQSGTHEDGRKTYGHSLVVDPWGTVLLDMGSEVGIKTLDISVDSVDLARSKIPSLGLNKDLKNPE
jgi:predicted amidohydrolase